MFRCKVQAVDERLLAPVGLTCRIWGWTKHKLF